MEVVDSGVGGEPFGGSDGSFGEGSAGFGFVGEDEAVAGAGGYQGVDTFDVSGAIGGNGNCVIEAGFVAIKGGEDGIAEGEGGAARCVEFADVVGLFDVEVVAGVLEDGGHFFRKLEHHLHADGVVGAVEERGMVLLRESADLGEVVVPTGGADDHAQAVGQAGVHVGDDGGGGGEVDRYVEVFEEGGGEGRGVVIFAGGEDADGVAALGCYFCYEAAGLAGAEDENAHGTSLVLVCSC